MLGSHVSSIKVVPKVGSNTTSMVAGLLMMMEKIQWALKKSGAITEQYKEAMDVPLPSK